MVIADGRVKNPLGAHRAGARCTWFLTPSNPVAARKKWIAGSLEPRGRAASRRRRGQRPSGGRSLLPAGVTRVEGGSPAATPC